jgi:hypothetical protein
MVAGPVGLAPKQVRKVDSRPEMLWLDCPQVIIDAHKDSEFVPLDLNNLGGHEFEDLIERLLIKMGFATEGRKRAADGGIDIIAVSSQPLLGGRIIVQCKRYSSSISSPIVRDLYGVVMAERASKGILITTSRFTSDAVEFAREKPLELIDGPKLTDILQKYSLLGNDYQGLTSSQTAVALLRSELAGLPELLKKQLDQTETRLFLEKHDFGDDNEKRTQLAYSKFVGEYIDRIKEGYQNANIVYSRATGILKVESPTLTDARQVRTDIENFFEYYLSSYRDVLGAKPPRLKPKTHEFLKVSYQSFLATFVDSIRQLVDLQETVKAGVYNLTIKFRGPTELSQASVEESKMIAKMIREGELR